jgi:anti-sigma B factor antagonist
MQPTASTQPQLELSWERVDARSAVLHLKGELELFTVRQVQIQAEEYAEDGVRRVVIDLEGVNFIDSAGICTIIRLYKQFRNSGTMCLVDPMARHRPALDLIQLTRLIPVYGNVASALAETGG